MSNPSNDEIKNSLALKLFGPAAESAGDTLQNLWQAIFGPFDLWAMKNRLSRDAALREFKETLEQKIIEIPASDVTEPKLSIAGPALEASKYYFEDKEIRDLFAALIAASMDARKERYLHPSFPDIIRQMSPLDAQNFLLFSKQLPVAEYYRGKKGSEVKQTLLSNAFISNPDVQDLELQSASVSSLVRLGLIRVEYEQSVLNQKFYTGFYETPFFLRLCAKLSTEGYTFGITPGRAVVTPLGKSFRAACAEAPKSPE